MQGEGAVFTTPSPDMVIWKNGYFSSTDFPPRAKIRMVKMTA